MTSLFSPPSPDDLIRLLKAWKFWVLGALAGALIGAAAYYITPPDYRARATVSVDFNLEQAWPEETDRQQFYYLERETRSSCGYFLLHKGLLKLKLTKRLWSADSIGGGVFGLVRALALIGLGFLGYGYYLDEANQPDSVSKALLLPIASMSAGFFEQFAPANRDLNAGAAKATNAATEGYAGADRAGLKEIVTTVTTDDKASSSDPVAAILTEEATSDAEPDRR